MQSGPTFRSTTLCDLVVWWSPALVDWEVSEEDFPSLRSLTIARCNSLYSLSVDCSLVHRVTVAVCPALSTVTFRNRATRVEHVHVRACDSLVEVMWFSRPCVRVFTIQHCTVLQSTVGFEDLPHLQELILRDNYLLRSLPCAPWSNLTLLDVSYSALSRLPRLTACPALCTLDVRGCAVLTELPSDLGTTCPQLTTLLCDSSAVQSLDPLVYAPQLATCSARECVLIEDARALGTCGALRVVRLCRAPLLRLHAASQNLRTLEWIDVPAVPNRDLVAVSELLACCPNLVDCIFRNNHRVSFVLGVAHRTIEVLDARACNHFPALSFNLRMPKLRQLYLSQSAVRGRFSTTPLPDLYNLELNECLLLENVVVARPLRYFSARYCPVLYSVQNLVPYCTTFSVFGSLSLVTR